MIPGLIRPWFTNAVELPPIVVTDTLVTTDVFTFGPYTVDSVTGGTGTYTTYETVISFASTPRTITLTGTDLNAAPDTVVDTGTLIIDPLVVPVVGDTTTLLEAGNFVGTLDNWTIDSAVFGIVGTGTVITTVTDDSGNTGNS